VILGTPTACPPKWLVDRYDDVLPVAADGRTRGFGSRRHYCFNSPSYLSESKRVVERLADRYGTHDAVSAWQTDNEYGGHDTVRCYCSNCRSAFRRWLEERYGSIDVLNAAWWNVFWSMEYRSFDEIELPNLAVTEANPSHSLDYCRFASDSVIGFNRMQVEVLRARSPGRPITHNGLIAFGDFDHYKLAADLDYVSWDNYPLGMLERSHLSEESKRRYMRTGHPDLIGFNHDLYFGLKQQPYLVMEQQPGQVNWAASNPLPATGMVRLWSHQAFAHGAWGVNYFRWRAAHGAQELMHAGLRTHADSEDRATPEVARVAAEIAGIEPGRQQSPVALLFDYENLWATNLQRHAQAWDYWSLQFDYYSALRGLGVDVDILHPSSDLHGYRLVLAPALHLVDDELADHLSAFVSRGGHLVLGPRSGFKNRFNTVHAPAPGSLASLVGGWIERVDALRPSASEGLRVDGKYFRFHTWADLLTPTDAEVVGEYDVNAYQGAAAIVARRHGRGRCTTIGAWGSEELHRYLFRGFCAEADIPVIELPEGVRICGKPAQTYVLNFRPEAVILENFGGTGLEVDGHDLLILKRTVTPQDLAGQRRSE
jgi:beta-galactosidase